MTNFAGRLLFVLAMARLATNVSYGQSTPFDSLSLEELTQIKVQTASLHSERLDSAPASISVVTGDEIRRYGYRSLGELLNHVPGIYVTYDYTYYSAGVAGFSVPGDWATRLLLMIDGHAMTDNIFGSANYFGDDFPLDMSMVDRVEIIRGPSSALYGSNGILATINVITVSPSSKAQTIVRAETDSLGERKVSLSQSFRFSSQSALLLSATVFNNRGIQDLSLPEFDSPLTNNGHALRMDGSRGYQLFGSFALGNWQILAVAASREIIQPVSWADTIFNDRGTRATDQRAFVDALYTRDLSRNRTLRWRVYYDSYRFKGDYRYPLVGNNDEAVSIDANHEYDAGDWVGSQATYRFPLFRGSLTAGAEIKIDLRALQSVADVEPVFHQDLLIDRRDKSAAGFLQQEWALSKHWSVNVGGRYDWSWYRRKSVSPRGALVYQPGKRTSVKLIYGEGFRNPNANELFFDDGKQNAGNPTLRPEHAWSITTVVERRIRRSWRWNASAWDLVDTNVIVPEINAQGLRQFENAAHFDSKGFEGQLSGNLFSQIEVAMSFQKQFTKLSSARPANSPSNVGKLQLGIPLARGIWATGALLYQNERRSNAGAVLPPVYLPELTLTAKSLPGGFEGQFGVRNVSNAFYKDPIGLSGSVDTIRQPGRTWFVTLTSSTHGR